MVSKSCRGSLAASALLLSLAAQTCSAGTMAAWLTAIGPQLVIQNDTTNGLMYSNCNSNNTPIFPVGSAKYFQLQYQPKPNTPIAGTGYYETGADAKTATSFWYIDPNGDIINSYQQCEPATGEFISMGADTAISVGMPKPANDTGLSAVLLGASEGYRVYYHDTSRNVQQIRYDPNAQKFLYDGVVSQDNFSSGAVSAAFDKSGDVSVIMTKMADIEVAQPGPNNTWSLVQFPEPLVSNTTNATARANIRANTTAPLNYTLPGWDGNANLGLSINLDYTLNVFYIGTDRHMYQLYSWYGAWDFQTNQSASVWPPADEPDAPFAIAYDETTLTIRMYYFSNQTLMEIGFYNDGTWHDATPVLAFNATAPAPSNTTSTPSATPAAGSGSGGLSAGAKAGVGVGVSLGALALIGGAVAFFCLRRQNRSGGPDAYSDKGEGSPGPMGAALVSQTGYSLAPYGGGYAEVAPYGSPPPQSEYSDYTAVASVAPPMVGPGGGGWDVAKVGYGYPSPPVEMASSVPTEIDGAPRPMYEMPDQPHSHELAAESQQQPPEAQQW